MNEEFCDSSSIQSDFSIIPENVVVDSEPGESDGLISTSISNITVRSIHENMITSTGRMRINRCLNTVTFGTIQRVNNDPTGDLAVVFSANGDYILKTTDRIGLYKTGFISTKDFITFVWVPVPPSNQFDSLAQITSIVVPSTVVFNASTIPEDKSEFYQFCYLTQDGEIVGVSVPFQLEQVERSQLIELENVAKNILAIRVNDLLEEQRKSALTIKDLKEEIKKKSEPLQIHEGHFEVVADFESMIKRSDDLEQKLLITSKELKDVQSGKELLQIRYEKDIQEKDGEIKEVTGKLTNLVMNHCALEGVLKKMNEDNLITSERNQVVIQDQVDLKNRLKIMNDELENAWKEKEATQKIASHLSDNNMKMAKKISTLMKVEMKIIEAVTSQGFQFIRPISHNHEGSEDRILPSNDIDDSVITSSTHSSCAKEVEESLGLKMDTIMKQLRDLKIDNQNILQSVVKRDDVDNSDDRSNVSDEVKLYNTLYSTLEDVEVISVTEINQLNSDIKITDAINAASSNVDIHENLDFNVQEINSDTEVQKNLNDQVSIISETDILTKNRSHEDDSNSAIGSDTNASASQLIVDDETDREPVVIPTVNEETISTASNKNLYDNSFLPTTQTAAVFLPSGSSMLLPKISKQCAALMSSLNCSTMTQTDNQSFSIISTQTEKGSSVVATAPALVPFPHEKTNISAACQLPPPLLPETTQCARNAAVLMQFKDSRNVESDDEDFHSTGDAGETREPNITETGRNIRKNLSCPMCPLSFLPEAINILKEHIDSHLENICPICSEAFSRSVPHGEFETHVQSHFEDDEVGPRASQNDSSGPWGNSPESDPSGFHLLEID